MAAAIAAAVAVAVTAAFAAGADPVVASGEAFGVGVAGAEFALSLSEASGWVAAAVAPAVAAEASAALAAATCLLPCAATAAAIALLLAPGLVAAPLFAGVPLAFPPVPSFVIGLQLPAVLELA